MTIEEFDKQMMKLADDYIVAVAAIAKEFQANVEALGAEADKAKLPDHLIAASAASALKKIEAFSS